VRVERVHKPPDDASEPERVLATVSGEWRLYAVADAG
jgi:hypothetical protein